MIKFGHKGEKVKLLQERLKNLGYEIKTDGIFGIHTESIVYSFQTACDLVVDGIYGLKTEEALKVMSSYKNKKEWLIQDTKNFKQKEFNCKCCGKNIGVALELLLKLEQLRFMLGKYPVIIRSGYRCDKHNKAVGGAIKSLHLTAKAADIVVANTNVDRVCEYANVLFENGGVGKYTRSGFVHVDIRGYKSRWNG